MPRSKERAATQTDGGDAGARDGGVIVGPISAASAEGRGIPSGSHGLPAASPGNPSRPTGSQATGSGTAASIVVVFNEVENNGASSSPPAVDDPALNEYNVLCASEYRSKQSGTGEASTPLAPGTRSFSQTPIYARITAHIPNKETASPAGMHTIGAMSIADAGLVAIVAPPLNTGERTDSRLPARSPPAAGQPKQSKSQLPKQRSLAIGVSKGDVAV